MPHCHLLDEGTSGSAVPRHDVDNDPELTAALAASLEECPSNGLKRSRQSEGEEATDFAVAKLAAIDPGPEPPTGPGVQIAGFSSTRQTNHIP